jgi:hypothetical protein
MYCYAVSIISQSEKISWYQMLLMICTYLPYFDWTIIISYFNYFDQFKFVLETVDTCLSVSHFMHEESSSGYFGSLSTVFLGRSLSRPNMLSHNCLYQEPHPCASCLILLSLYG